jgi:hypothetical protein
MTSTRKRFTRSLVTPFEEDADLVTPPRGARASRDGDARVRGKRIAAKRGSPSQTGRATAIGGRRRMPFFDPERHLLAEFKPARLTSTLDAATGRGRPVSYHLQFTVHPRDARSFARVVADRVTRLMGLFD